MEKKSFTTLMKFHLILLCVLILSRAFNAFMIFSGNVISEAKDWFSPSEAGFFGVINLTMMVALILCFVYCWNHYSKQAAGYYKGFLCLSACASVLTVFAVRSVDALNMNLASALVIAVAIMVVKAVLLLVLGFWKDLGEKNTWIVFYIILVLDLIFGFLFADVSSVRFYRIGQSIARLAVDGTIGLSIRGKFEDKKARGSEV